MIRVSNTFSVQVLNAPDSITSNTFGVQVQAGLTEIVSNAFSVQVIPYLQGIVSNAFPVQVLSTIREEVSNTFSITPILFDNTQVIKLTSIHPDSSLFGLADVNDEWVTDLLTDGGLDVNIQFDGLYTISDLPGKGAQQFGYSYLDDSVGLVPITGYTEFISAVAAPAIISNTFSATVSPPVTSQVIVLTSAANGMAIGDEWVVDLVTAGGLPIVIASDGTYTVTGITGQGNQVFNWFAIDVSDGLNIIQIHIETAIDPDTLPIAPTISTQPSNQSIAEGVGSVIFSVIASGRPDPTYQWNVGGVPIIGQTESTLTVLGSQIVFANNGDSYTVDVTNNAGSVTSNAASLTVTELPQAPVISSQPTNQIVTEGTGSAVFSVTASAVNTISYQWEILSGINYINIVGETGTTLTIAGNTVTNEDDNFTGYRCKLTNTEGSIYTIGISLEVLAIPDEAPDATLASTAITDSSFNVTFTADEAGTFRLVVLANNSTPPTANDIFSGTNLNNLVMLSPMASMDLSVQVITPIPNLDSFTPYDVYAALIDSEGNSRLLVRLDVTTSRDTTKPVIYLNGTSTVRIPVYQEYIDQGAVLQDNIDTDRAISATGTVNYNLVGIYTVSFDGSDSEGNAADTVTRTVVVYDPNDISLDGGVIADIVEDTIDTVIDEVID